MNTQLSTPIQNKHLLIISILVLVLIIVAQINRRWNLAIEPMADSGGIVGQIKAPFAGVIKFVESIEPRINHIGNAITDIGLGFKDGMVAIGDSIGYAGSDMINIMSAGIDVVPPFLGEALKAEAENINNVIEESNQGLNDFFKALPKAVDPYLFDSSSAHDGLFDRLAKYINMYMNCGFKIFKNLYFCLIFYILDTVLEIIKLFFVTIPIFLVGLIGINVSPYYGMIYAQIVNIDDVFFSLSGYHLFFYSDTVLDTCYFCDGIPHKGRSDYPLKTPPGQPVLSAPAFPADIRNSTKALSDTYNNVIPKQMKAVGRFLGNSINSDMEVSDGYTNAANNMKSGFNGAISTAANHFNNIIPGEFATARDDFNNVGTEFNAAFAPL